MSSNNYGPGPLHCICPHCSAKIKTTTAVKATTKTFLISLLLCALCCLPCMCIPFCVDNCRNVNHFCPACNNYLGSYKS